MTLATTHKHGLDAPSVTDLRASLARMTPHGFDALWLRLCQQADVPTWAGWLPVADLRRLCDVVIAEGGLHGVAGRGIAVRLSSYELLSRAEVTP